jgi:hypothetical protein
VELQGLETACEIEFIRLYERKPTVSHYDSDRSSQCLNFFVSTQVILQMWDTPFLALPQDADASWDQRSTIATPYIRNHVHVTRDPVPFAIRCRFVKNHPAFCLQKLGEVDHLLSTTSRLLSNLSYALLSSHISSLLSPHLASQYVQSSQSTASHSFPFWHCYSLSLRLVQTPLHRQIVFPRTERR